MVDNTTSAITHWAVLIGINYYVKKKCLAGIVRDAETTKQYFEAEHMPADIIMLTATSSTDPDSTRPLEQPQFWLTRVNVIQSLLKF